MKPMYSQLSPALFLKKVQPEIAIILLAIRNNLNDEEKLLLREYLAGPISWEDLILGAEFHKVLALVIRTIKQIDEKLVPEKHWGAWLDEWLPKIAQRSQIYRQELVRLTTVFKSEGIDVISFKGPILAEKTYPEIGLRDFSDIDLMVDKENLQKVQGILAEQNYDWIFPKIAGYEVKHFEHYHFAYLYSGTDLSTGIDIDIDLHWKILPGSFSNDLGYSDFIGQAVEFELDGCKVLTLSDIDTLIYLCIHAGKEHWKKLRMLVDLSLWIETHPNIDWLEVKNRAAELEVVNIVDLGVYIAVKWYGVSVPDWLLQQILENRMAHQLYDDIEKYLISGEVPLSTGFNVTKYSLMLMDNNKHRLRQRWRTIITPEPDHIRLIELPESLDFFYIPIKVVYDYLYMPLNRIFKIKKGVEKLLFHLRS